MEHFGRRYRSAPLYHLFVGMPLPDRAILVIYRFYLGRVGLLQARCSLGIQSPFVDRTRMAKANPFYIPHAKNVLIAGKFLQNVNIVHI